MIHDVQTSIFATDNDKVVFGAGITTANVRFTRSGDDLIISVTGTSDTLTIEGQFASGNLGLSFDKVEEFQFADGTNWSWVIVQNQLLQGTAGNDVLVGYSTADTLDGGAGNDRLEGSNDGDTYVFDAGYGQDTILDVQSDIFATAPDKVTFGAGVTTANVRLSRSGNDLIIAIDGQPDTLKILGAVRRRQSRQSVLRDRGVPLHRRHGLDRADRAGEAAAGHIGQRHAGWLLQRRHARRRRRQ